MKGIIQNVGFWSLDLLQLTKITDLHMKGFI